MIDRVTGDLYSTGRFASPSGADSDGAGATASSDAEGYPFPGQDFTVAFDSIPPLDLDNGLFAARITLEPEPDNDDAPFALTLLEKNIAAGTLVLEIENLPPLLTGAHYEAWVRFDDDSLRSLGGFRWSGNGMIDLETGESVAGLPAPCTLVGGVELFITVEGDAGDDTRSSGSVIVASPLGGADTTLAASDAAALGDGFDDTEAFYTLATPSSADEDDYKFGIWFFHVDENGDTLPAADLPPAPSGWHYESWVRKGGNSPDEYPVSLGTFERIDSLDSDGAGPNAGDDSLAVLPAYPGQDFLVDAGGRWISDGNHEAFLSLEPDDDFSPETIFLTLFHDAMIVDVGANTSQAMEGMLQSLPEGPGRFSATAVYEMESNGDRLPKARVAAGK